MQRIHHKRAGISNRGRWLRWTAAALFAALGYVSITQSLANAVVRADASRAHMLAPSNGRITAAHAEMVFNERPAAGRNSPASVLGRAALRQDPTAIPALTVLGLQAALAGDMSGQDRIFAYALALSRRELRAHIWAIEDAVNNGDVGRALNHYNLALNTSSGAQATLFPVLSSAIREPEIRRRLYPMVEKSTAWGQSFLGYITSTGADPEAAFQFLEEGHSHGLSIPKQFRADLVTTLTKQGRFDLAWETYRALRPRASRDRSRDPAFAFAGLARTPFDWQIGGSPEIEAVFGADGSGRALEFMIPTGITGEIVRQLQMLPPGGYRLMGRAGRLATAESAAPFWTVACRGGRELARIAITTEGSEPAFSGTFTVPAGCSEQVLALVAGVSNNPQGLAGAILHAEIVPSGRAAKLGATRP